MARMSFLNRMNVAFFSSANCHLLRLHFMRIWRDRNVIFPTRIFFRSPVFSSEKMNETLLPSEKKSIALLFSRHFERINNFRERLFLAVGMKIGDVFDCF